MNEAGEFAFGIAPHAVDEFEPILLIGGGIGGEEKGEPTRSQTEEREDCGPPEGAGTGKEARHGMG